MVFQIKEVREFNQNCSPTGTPTLGGSTGSCPLCPHPWGAGGARVALRTEFFPSLLSSEGAFSGIADSLLQVNFFFFSIHLNLLQFTYYSLYYIQFTQQYYKNDTTECKRS